MGKQVIVDNEFLRVLAEEKSTGEFFHPNALYKRIKERLARRFGAPDFEVSMSQVGRSIEKLSREGFIEVKTSRASKEEVRSVENVELTLWGLFRVLEHIFVQETPTDEVLRETLDRIAKSQTEKLPLILKKWRYFSNLGMQEKVIGRLRSYFHFFPEGYHYTPEYCFVNRLTAAGVKEVTRKEFECMRLETFYDYVFLFYPECGFLPEEEMKRWNDALVHDAETKRYAIERLCLQRDKHALRVLELSQRIRVFKDS